jgi:hypothetical protein
MRSDTSNAANQTLPSHQVVLNRNIEVEEVSIRTTFNSSPDSATPDWI